MNIQKSQIISYSSNEDHSGRCHILMNKQVSNFIVARNEARKLANKQKDQIAFARQFLAEVLTGFIPSLSDPPVTPLKHPLAEKLSELARFFNLDMAAYLIGTTYTVMLPQEYRSQYGVFYTPPVLTERLLDLAEQSGVDWGTARILDPACGGGAFLAPAAKRMLAALGHLSPEERLAHIETHLHGYEIDPFSAWISQILVEGTLRKEIAIAGRPLAKLVQVKDSLKTSKKLYGKFDLVVGNPPYGRIKLSKEERVNWTRSLYGHANLYGLFSDLATHLVAPQGIVAYVTPTSFLGGQYFSALRGILAKITPPVAIDFIAHREGVFADVLQETLLAVYQKNDQQREVSVSYLLVKETDAIEVCQNGSYSLPSNPEKPWILPREVNQSDLAKKCYYFTHRLSDFGYTVSTGPLVWNRHKDKLFNRKVKGVVPLIWAECVSPSGSGDFTFKATNRNHVPWFKPSSKDDSNIIRQACILLQRTTSLEQSRRLIAAELPQSFIDEHGGAVTIENHLNMIRPIEGRTPLIKSNVIATLLNSETVDRIFRCINGSTAVSAYELKSMPLPSPSDVQQLEKLLEQGASKNIIEDIIKEMYSNVRPLPTA
jgi:adenine-specific DNA-methyltransferase